MHILRSLCFKDSVLERDDVQAEFWRGVLVGMDKVKHNIGDPVSHLIQRGVWQVKSVVKSEISRQIVQYCSHCCAMNDSYSYRRACNKCGGSVENMGRLVELEDYAASHEYVHNIGTVMMIKVVGALSETQKIVLERIVQLCVDGSHDPAVDAARSLGISRQRVHQHIQKIRPKVLVDLTAN